MTAENYYNWRLVILATAFSGASALIYEIIASRILLLFFGSALTSLTIVLITFLGGLSLGSALMTIFRKKLWPDALIFSLLELIIAFYSIAILSQFINLPSLFDTLSSFISQPLLVQFIGGAIFVFVPTVLLGAIFPLAVTMLTDQSGQNLTKRVGWLYTLDVLGAVAGAALAGFFILPNYGNTATIIFAASLNILAAFIIFPKKNKVRIIWVILLFLFLITSGLMLKNPIRYLIPKDAYNANPTYLKKDDLSIFNKKNILWEKPSPFGVITVTEQQTELGLDKTLNIDNWGQCSKLEHASEKFIAQGALQDTPNAQVLNIGLGCGFTLAAVLESNPQEVTVVEINPVVYEAAALFKEDTSQAIADPRVEIIIKDGAEFLRTTDQKYDAIIIDIEHPFVAHSSPLYTVEYFRYAKKHLNENGRLALWGYHSNDPRYLKSLVTTFQEVFSNVVFAQFDAPGPYYLFLASDGPLSAQSIDENGTSAELMASLESVEDVPPNTLDQPTLGKYSR